VVEVHESGMDSVSSPQEVTSKDSFFDYFSFFSFLSCDLSKNQEELFVRYFLCTVEELRMSKRYRCCAFK
jgi:hypothetical protein